MHDGPVVPALSCVGFEPPMAGGPVVVRNHRVLPLKARLLDAGGVAVGEGIAAPPVVRVTYEPGTGSPVDVTSSALHAGRGTAENAFSFDADAGRWQLNLVTRGFAEPGTYRVTAESGDPLRYAISPTCEATFVIE